MSSDGSYVTSGLSDTVCTPRPREGEGTGVSSPVDRLPCNDLYRYADGRRSRHPKALLMDPLSPVIGHLLSALIAPDSPWDLRT